MVSFDEIILMPSFVKSFDTLKQNSYQGMLSCALSVQILFHSEK